MRARHPLDRQSRRLRVAAALVVVAVAASGCIRAARSSTGKAATDPSAVSAPGAAEGRRNFSGGHKPKAYGAVPPARLWPLAVTAGSCDGLGDCGRSFAMDGVIYGIGGRRVPPRLLRGPVVGRGSVHNRVTVVRAVRGVPPEVMVAVRKEQRGPATPRRRTSPWLMSFQAAHTSENPPRGLQAAWHRAVCIVAGVPAPRRCARAPLGAFDSDGLTTTTVGDHLDMVNEYRDS